MTNITMPGFAGTGEVCPKNGEALPGSDTGTGLKDCNITGDDYTPQRELEAIAHRALDRNTAIACAFFAAVKRREMDRRKGREVEQ